MNMNNFEKMRILRILRKIVIISAVAFFCVYVFYLPYNEIRTEMIKALGAEHRVLARQAAEGIQAVFDHYSNTLDFLARLPEIIHLDARGEERMKDFYESHFTEIKAITRIDARGKIIYTSPYNRSLIGVDVSMQEHNRFIRENQRPVLSDVFHAVQGYHAVAYSYPVFNGSSYNGCIAILISFGDLAGKHIGGIRTRKEGYAWMLSRKGVIIYSPVPMHLGMDALEVYREFPAVTAMVNEMVRGWEGSAVVRHREITASPEGTVRYHAYYLPVHLPGTFWSIAVETPEDGALSAMESFKNRWLVIMFLFSAGVLVYFYYFIKARAVLKEEEKRKEAEKLLRESERKYSELTESLPLSVFEFDMNGMFTYVNRTALEEFRYTAGDISRGLNVLDVLDPSDRERAITNIMKVFRGGDILREEYAARRSDGSTFPFIVNMERVVREGRTEGMRGVVINISDRKRLEAEILKAQKLESIGLLAGGIAHDFNNLLMVVLGNISLMKLDMGDDESAMERIESMEKAGLQAAELTKQLLTFSRGGNPVKEPVSLPGIIQDSLKFALSGTTIAADCSIDGGLWSVEADAGQMKQVFNNLIINSRQSMADGGTVRIRALNMTDEIEGAGDAGGDRKVKITIEDQGAGIPAENLGKIFDPYFTTKEKGSGLGLAVTYSIIRNHDGKITVESEVGRGTKFTIILPASGSQVRVVPGDAEALMRGEGKILIMDDEIMIRNVTAWMLTDLGYTVGLARDGAEAVEEFRRSMQSGAPYDAVIMDITVIGGMGGKDAVKMILALDPAAKVIATSGYNADPHPADYHESGFVAFIAKPYSVSNLGRVIHDVLRG